MSTDAIADTLPAVTEFNRFGGRFSQGKWHIVHLPEAPGPWRNLNDHVAACGRTPEGAAVVVLRGEPDPESICKDCRRADELDPQGGTR